jgi:RNA polymerase sigma-70 factor (ECF subfamily)
MTDPRLDPHLLAALRAGDDTAFERFFRAWYPGLADYACRILGAPDLAEDAVQEVLVEVWKRRDSLPDADALPAWLFRSVRNRAFNHRRDGRREVAGDEVAMATAASEDDTPEEVLQRLEAAGFLRLLLAELEEADRRLVQLKYFEDLRYREIAERTEMSIGNVGYRLHHILKQLADKLRHLGIDGIS